MAKPKPPQADETQVRSLLQKYNCPVPYHEVRTLFLGNIATPSMTASPLQIVKGLWGDEMPEFESMEAANELIGTLINGLWNSLTRHQKRTAPFRLIRTPVEPTKAGFSSHVQMRQEEIDGFFDGLYDGQDEINLPEKAGESLDILAQLRSMLAGAHALASDDSQTGQEEEFAKALKQILELTPIIEREINTVVLACTRARRDAIRQSTSPRPTLH